MRLAACESQASISRSSSSNMGFKLGQVSRSTNSSTMRTSHKGLMRAMRSRMACTFACPTLAVVACTWRLMLDSAT